MTIHKEGHTIILVSFLILAVINLIVWYFSRHTLSVSILAVISLVFFFLVVYFFRLPNRDFVINENQVICPADGKVVIIKETQEDEYFKDKRIQVSVFMSPLNVHVNRYPVGGKIAFYKYHPGKFLLAWEPKSSLLNERTTVVIEKENGIKVLTRQIAGFVARRIICYSEEGKTAKQCEELGFIKFGSRVDLFLPLGTNILVKEGMIVRGGETVIANFN